MTTAQVAAERPMPAGKRVLLIVGGGVAAYKALELVRLLKKAGVAAIFQPGTAMDEIVQFIRTHVKGPGVPAAG